MKTARREFMTMLGGAAVAAATGGKVFAKDATGLLEFKDMAGVYSAMITPLPRARPSALTTTGTGQLSI